MQVAKQTDHLTHAVIGQKKSISMGVSDDSSLMHILSAALYTHPHLAAVREIMCNGWDAMINNGTTNRPLEVTVTEKEFKVRDFGKGIHADMIGEIYGTYGGSTKRDDNTVTGGFGLGSKAPFAIVDNFEVTSVHEGVKTIYRVSKSSMEVGGKPSINEIVSMPTDEHSGITVRVDFHDSQRIINLVREVAYLGEIFTHLNGEPVEMMPLTASPHGFILMPRLSGTIVGPINIRYGNVVYPVPDSVLYEAELDAVKEAMHRIDYALRIVFQAPPDSVSIAPSREALILSPNTVDTIKQLLKSFRFGEIKSASKTAGMMVNKIKKDYVSALQVHEVQQNLLDGATPSFAIQDTMSDVLNGYSYSVRRAALVPVLHRTLSHNRSADAVFFNRVHALIKGKAKDSKSTHYPMQMLKAVYKARKLTGCDLTEKVQAIFARHISYPLLSMIAGSKLLSRDRVSYGMAKYRGSTPDQVKVGRQWVDDLDSLFQFAEKKVVFYTNKQLLNDFMWVRRRNGDANGWVIYQLPASRKNHQAIIDEWRKAGWIDSTTIPAPEEAVEAEEEGTPAVRKKYVKRKGYLTLRSSVAGFSNPKYLLTTAREKCKPEDLVTNPIAWVVLNSKNEGCHHFAKLTSGESAMANKLWGDKVAVVTSVQAEALKVKGIPDIMSYIYEHVDEELSKRRDFARYLAFAYQNDEEHVHRSTESRVLACRMIYHETVMKELGLRFSVSTDTRMLLTFFRKDSDRYSSREGKMVKCEALAKKIPQSPQFRELELKIQKSEWKKFLKLEKIVDQLDTNTPDSPETAIPYELIRKLTQ